VYDFRKNVCGDRLLAYPCLLYCFYRNVPWGRWFTYLHMYSYQSLFVPAARRSCAALVCRRPADPVHNQVCVDLVSPVCYRMTISHVIVAVFILGARFLDTFQVRRCWIKIDSAVNLGEKPSSEFVHCVLWVIRLMKTVESICCAVRHTVALPRLLSDAHHI